MKTKFKAGDIVTIIVSGDTGVVLEFNPENLDNEGYPKTPVPRYEVAIAFHTREKGTKYGSEFFSEEELEFPAERLAREIALSVEEIKIRVSQQEELKAWNDARKKGSDLETDDLENLVVN